ncbi:PP2C family serine/threonine-protein phosphatase [Sporosarcina sp. FSL W7-1349]|uniref:PP2C family serine/threonine-protein phosphatase n=1 Tax=Sporosarcina sp. FSL W7-1349 TaxID=2921561 RepID=UPI0030FC692B
MHNWRSSSAYARGASHTEWGTPCQDRAVHYEWDGAHAIVLADGAGSYESSHLGAELIVTKLAYYLCEKFDRLSSLESQKLAEELHFYIHQELNALVLEHDRNKEDFSSTLLFVVTKGQDYIAGHVGDGMIVKCESGDVEILSAPENGLYENETYFVSMETLDEHFRIYRGSVTEDLGFIIMSDGSTASFLSKSQGLDTQNLGVIIDHFQKSTANTFKHDLTELLAALVDNTDDDCSIAVLAASKEDPIPAEPSKLMAAIKGEQDAVPDDTVIHVEKSIDELLAPREFEEDEEEFHSTPDDMDDSDEDHDLYDNFEYEDFEDDLVELDAEEEIDSDGITDTYKN